MAKFIGLVREGRCSINLPEALLEMERERAKERQGGETRIKDGAPPTVPVKSTGAVKKGRKKDKNARDIVADAVGWAGYKL